MKPLLTLVGFVMITLPSASPALAQAPPSPARPPTPPAEPVGRHCPTVVVYQGGTADNFAPGIDLTHPSLALEALLQGQSPVVYDDAANCNHWFGDSLRLDACVFCCGICSAMLEITLRGCGSTLDCNDTIYVGQAPFNIGGPGGYLLWSGLVDPNGCGGFPVDLTKLPVSDRAQPAPDARKAASSGSTVVKTITLDPRKLAELLCERKVTTLDVLVQDDQIVDSMRLIITKP